MKSFSAARLYYPLVTDIKSFIRSGSGGLETSSKARILAFLVFLAIFHAAVRGTRSKTMLMNFFGNTTLMYLLSRRLFHVIMSFAITLQNADNYPQQCTLWIPMVRPCLRFIDHFVISCKLEWGVFHIFWHCAKIESLPICGGQIRILKDGSLVKSNSVMYLEETYYFPQMSLFWTTANFIGHFAWNDFCEQSQFRGN